MADVTVESKRLFRRHRPRHRIVVIAPDMVAERHDRPVGDVGTLRLCHLPPLEQQREIV